MLYISEGSRAALRQLASDCLLLPDNEFFAALGQEFARVAEQRTHADVHTYNTIVKAIAFVTEVYDDPAHYLPKHLQQWRNYGDVLNGALLNDRIDIANALGIEEDVADNNELVNDVKCADFRLNQEFAGQLDACRFIRAQKINGARMA